MDDSSIDPGLSVSAFTPRLPSITAGERQSQNSLQRPRTTPVEAQKPETSAETRQAQPRKDLSEEVALANTLAAFLNQQVSLHYDERIDQIVVQVTRGDDAEVIRQIPSEEMIKLMAKFRKDFRGLLFDRSG